MGEPVKALLALLRSGVGSPYGALGKFVNVPLQAGLQVGGLVLMDHLSAHEPVDHRGDLGKTFLGLLLVLRFSKAFDEGPCGLMVIVVPGALALVGSDPPQGGTMIRHSSQLLLRDGKIREILGSCQVLLKKEDPEAGMAPGPSSTCDDLLSGRLMISGRRSVHFLAIESPGQESSSCEAEVLQDLDQLPGCFGLLLSPYHGG